MRPGKLLKLVEVNLARDLRGALFASFGVGVGIAALSFFVALGAGLGDLIRTKIFPADLSLVEVVPPALSLGSVLGGGKLDESAVQRLTAISGVQAAYRKMALKVPAISRYDGPFFGAHLRIAVELLVVGVERAYVEKDLAPGRSFEDPGPGKAFPALVSSRALEIYNKSFAPLRELPRLTPSLLVGFEFPAELGRSFLSAPPPGPVEAASVSVVGVSDRGLMAGVVAPLPLVRRLQKQYGMDDSTYSSVVLLAADPSEVTRVVAAVREMGFEIDDSERRMAENVGAAVSLTTLALSLLSGLLCLMAGVNIAHSLSASVRNRQREIGVLRAVGATRGEVALVVLAEAAAIGLGGGVAGAVSARLAAFGLDALARTQLPEFPFKPQSFFHFPLWLLLAGAGLGVLAAVLGAYGPARSAARVDPARAQAG